MDVQKITTGVTAAAVIGTGATIGGGQIVDNYTGGPEKRANAEEVSVSVVESAATVVCPLTATLLKAF